VGSPLVPVPTRREVRGKSIPRVLLQPPPAQFNMLLRNGEEFMLAINEILAIGTHHLTGTARAHEVEPAVVLHGQFYPALFPDSVAQVALVVAVVLGSPARLRTRFSAAMASPWLPSSLDASAFISRISA